MDIDTSVELSGLGYSRIDIEHLTTLVGRAVHRRVRITTVRVLPVDYPQGSIATGALMRCVGTAIDEGGGSLEWSIFVKQLQSARVWPLLHVIPEPHRTAWVEDFPWRLEIDSYQGRLAELMPAGFRLPAIYDIVEIDDDRAAIWMEDVQPAAPTWDVDWFRRAAHGLGVLAGRRPCGSDVVFGSNSGRFDPGSSIRMLAFGRIRMGVAAALEGEAVWQHPALVATLTAAGERGMRDELRAAMGRLDEWLDRMDALPQTYVHGDASPQNLLVPSDDPDTFVVIDFGFNAPHCVGFDLGQLLVGLTHADAMPVDRLSDIRMATVPAYLAGLRSTGFEATTLQVEEGQLLSVLVRSLFTALPLEMLTAPDSAPLRSLLTTRIGLCRFLLDLARTV